MRLDTIPFAATLCAAPRPTRVTLGLIAAGFVISTAVNWPGHLSYDSLLQLAEGRHGVYGNWHPPVMSWLLGVTDAVWRGPALFVLLEELMIYGSLAAFVLLGGARAWLAAVLAGIFVLTPQLVIYPAIVWKDVLFAGSMLAGFGALAFAAQYWNSRWLRWPALGKAAVLLVLAALARQNGMLILLFAAAAAGVVAGAAAPARRWLTGGVYGFAALALLFGLMLGGKALLGLRTLPGNGPSAQFRLLEAYDIIGALHREPQLALPLLDDQDPELERLMRSDGVRLYTPERNDTLSQSQKLSDEIWDAPDGAIAAQWKSLFLQRPGLYLATRWAAFAQVFFTPDIGKCVPYAVGIDGPPETMAELGYTRRWDWRDMVVDGYGQIFFDTPLLRHEFWALAALLVLALVLLRRRPVDWVVAAMLGAGLSFAASFFVISIACDYRYLVALDLASMAGALYAAGDWRELLAPWRRGARGVSGDPASP